MTNRYENNPFLMLMEFYVLNAIGQLSDVRRVKLERMAPQLRELYTLKGTWDQVVAGVARLPGTTPDAIRGVWRHNAGLAKKRGETLDAQEFARMFVDANFSR